MSLAAMTWAFVCSPTEGPARSVLLALADFANDDDVAWPANSTLVTYSGYAERTVRDALRRLEAAGAVEALPDYPRQMRKVGAWTTPYRLHVELCRWDGAPPEGAPWSNKCAHRGMGGAGAAPPGRSRRRGGQEPPVGGAGAAPEPPMEPPQTHGSHLPAPTPDRAPAREPVARSVPVPPVALLRAGLRGQLTDGPIPGDQPLPLHLASTAPTTTKD